MRLVFGRAARAHTQVSNAHRRYTLVHNRNAHIINVYSFYIKNRALRSNPCAIYYLTHALDDNNKWEKKKIIIINHLLRRYFRPAAMLLPFMTVSIIIL